AFVDGVFLPFNFISYASSTHLLSYPGFYISFSKTNLCPSFVVNYSRCCVGITDRDNFLGGRNLCFSHYSISCTFSSINSISSGLRPYFLYNCWSISGIDLDQSMSEFSVKSWSGTYFQTLEGLC